MSKKKLVGLVGVLLGIGACKSLDTSDLHGTGEKVVDNGVSVPPDAGVDAPLVVKDLGREGPSDGGVDSPVDQGTDTRRDLGADVGVDAPIDMEPDIPFDEGVDVYTRDIGIDAPTDANVDAPSDFGVDLPIIDPRRDSGEDGPSDAGVDLGSDGNLDLGVDAPLDIGVDLPPDLGPDMGPDSGVIVPWWSEGEDWTYRRGLYVRHNGDSTLNNFPILVHREEGIVGVDTASLIATGKMQENCNDLRIVTSEGLELPFEFESGDDLEYGCNTENTILWVSVDGIVREFSRLASVYYGNPLAEDGERREDVWSPNYVGVYHFGNNLDDVVRDSTSNGNHGTIHGASLVNGRFGRGLSFDGVGNYVEIPDSGDSTFVGGNVTLSVCVRTSYSSSSNESIVARDDGLVNREWNLHIRDDGIGGFYRNDGLATIGGGEPINNGEWNCFVGVVSEGLRILYINGVEENSAVVSPDLSNTGINLEFGRRGGRYFSGEIEEVRLYRGVRSSDEIKRDCEQGFSRLGEEETLE